LRNTQRVMKMADPRSAEFDLAQLVDDRFMKKIDGAGVVDRAYAAQ
jgi:hypothetical protein